MNWMIALKNHGYENYVMYTVQHINAITPFTVDYTVNGAMALMKSISIRVSDSYYLLPVRSRSDGRTASSQWK